MFGVNQELRETHFYESEWYRKAFDVFGYDIATKDNHLKIAQAMNIIHEILKNHGDIDEIIVKRKP